MKAILFNLMDELNEWFQHIDEVDLEDIEYGRPFHFKVSNKGKTLRAVIFLERHEI